MTPRKRDTSLGVGVYFTPEDYVGMMRRIVIFVVDLAVLIGFYILSGALFIAINGNLNGTFALIYVSCVWAYLTVIKASKIRIAGYWVTGAKILNLRGDRPSVFRMTFRMLLWMLGPFNVVYDLLWSGIDDDRQSLRDRYAGTCVVNNRAEPVGSAEIHLVHYNAFGFTLMYPRVMRPKNVESKIDEPHTNC